MKLKHVHLFGILLLSLVLASFLGKYIDFGKEGLENENDATSKVTNQHTGGDADPDEGGDADEAIPPNPGRSAEATYGNESTVADADADASSKGVEGFGGLFDSVLPASSGFTLEQFISPFSNVEGLKGGSGSGITQDQIPKGQEHLYILKSQVVPPTTCPVCPSFGGKGDGAADSEHGGGGGGGGGASDSSGLSNGLGSAFPGGSGGAGGSSSKCPPCPACARCPEPSFECKKVPNYAISQNGAMSVPRPVLADFSQFGM